MRLRAHHLLCLLGFRGLGYSPEFVENMSHIAERLRSFPQIQLEILGQPDDICSQCPFLGEGGCQDKGPQSEEERRKRDLDVMERIEVEEGGKLTWSEAEERIRSALTPGDLERICRDCEWLPQGYCTQGLENLIKRAEGR